MFKYITQILTPGQRILTLLVSVTLIIMLLLINSITKTCNELTVKLENQEQQIIQLNQRVFELNYQVSNGQTEIIDIVEGMIEDVELSDKIEKWP
jgi:hypothetical protein